MNPSHHLSWENFKSTVFIPGQQRVHLVADAPYVELFGDGIQNRVGIWLEVASDTAIPSEMSKLAFITTRTLSRKGRVVLEVATSTPSLCRQFYYFAVAVAERVLLEKCVPIRAVGLELQSFTDLLEEKSLLGVERQIGLLGELILLERLIKKADVGALDSWLGPLGEPHDFRVGASEFEVKATVSSHRIHTVHGTEQLVASKGCLLYLVSVLLGPAGASSGFSLSDKVAQLSGQFAPAPDRLNQFTTALEAYGFRDFDQTQYTRKFVMRRPMGLIAVNKTFPAITRPTIQAALGLLAPRIESVQYDVNVEGLEHEDGTIEFETVIPG